RSTVRRRLSPMVSSSSGGSLGPWEYESITKLLMDLKKLRILRVRDRTSHRGHPPDFAQPSQACHGRVLAAARSRLGFADRGRVAQWESARFTRERSLVQAQPCPFFSETPGCPGRISSA